MNPLALGAGIAVIIIAAGLGLASDISVSLRFANAQRASNNAPLTERVEQVEQRLIRARLELSVAQERVSDAEETLARANADLTALMLRSAPSSHQEQLSTKLSEADSEDPPGAHVLLELDPGIAPMRATEDFQLGDAGCGAIRIAQPQTC